MLGVMAPMLNRRQALGAFGTVSVGALLTGCGEEAAPPTTETQSKLLDEGNSCNVTTELTEGPYYFDADAIRRDIREDREGVKLRLVLRVREANGCAPISNAVVDVWHSDAQGAYSGFEAASNSPGGGVPGSRTDEERYLRGAQVTNDEGVAEFVTIVPGRYPGRTPHIHVKVHLDRRTLLTTQLFFDERTLARVHRQRPYSQDRGQDVTNSSDSIFEESLVLGLRKHDGWVGAVTLDVARA